MFGVGFSLFGGLAMARGLRREQTGGRRAVPEARIFLQQLTQSAADQAEALRHLDASIARLSAGAANVKKRRNSWLPNVLAILLIVGAVLLLSNDPDLIQPDKANWPTAAYYALLAAFLWVLALRLAVAFLRYRVARDLQLSVDLRYTVAQVSRSPGNAIPRLDRTPDSSPCLLTHNPNGAASLTRRRRPDRRASAPLRSASRAPAASLRDACAMASPPLTRTSAALLCSAT